MVVNKHSHTPTARDVYIGRGSIWGNPFSHRAGTSAKVVVASRAEAIARHRAWLWSKIKSGEVTVEALAALHGRTLVCFCAPQACHGHTLVKAAAWANAQLDAPRCRTCLGSGRVRSTAEAVPGHVWSAQPCPSCRPGVV